MGDVMRVQQEHRFGCQVAVAAMLMGIRYDEAKALLIIDLDLNEQGMGHFVLDSVLASNGYAIARRYEVMQPGNRKRETWPCDPWADVHWCEVMPTAHSSSAHAVLMLDDGSVIDPDAAERKRLADYAKVNFIAAVVPIKQREPRP